MEVIKEKKRKVAEEYLSSLADLNLNSKPLINMLTILAEENIEHAEVIVNVVQQHIEKVNPEVKLPILYLIDSIVKNVKQDYIKIFSNCIVHIFCGAFEKVNEKIREKMYTLRQTWNDVFPLVKLYALDVKVNCLDPNWPITAKVIPKSTAIHVNPNFLVEKKDGIPKDIHIKQRKLLELQKQKLELELEATKKQLQQQEDGMATVTSQINTSTPSNIPNQIPMNRVSFNNQFRPTATAIKNPGMSNAFGSFGQQNAPRIKIAPVNPVMMNSLNKRDPRLARQQNNSLQQNINNHSKVVSNQVKHIQQPDQIRPLEACNDERDVQNLEKSRPKGNSNNSLPSTKRSAKRDYSSNSKALDGHLSSETKSNTSKVSKSSSSTRSPNTYSSPSKRSSDKMKKLSPSERKRSSSKDNSTKREEKAAKSPSKTGSPNHKGSVSPNSPRFKEFRSSEHKSRNYIRRNKEISKSPSPVKDVDEKMESPDKRFKFTIPKKESSIEKLDQNSDGKSSDTDLRMNLLKIDKLETGNSSNHLGDSIKMSPTRMLIERAEEIRTSAIGKKRSSTDQQANTEELDQPVVKKLKSEKIDNLFGSEDVDLRVAPSLISVAPPPPIISNENENENENWAKVKGSSITKDEKISPMRSTLEDVRAKLAKAAKNSNYKFNKNRKVSAIKQNLNLEINEDSRDANDDNLRVIINQAQELYDSENINAEQYNSLVTTVMQINENNKLKEAKRRESMLDKSNSEEKPKEQRKRIPKLAKGDQTNDKIEQTSILQQPKSTTIVGRNEAASTENDSSEARRKRPKESKWSSATPWENKQGSSTQQPWVSSNNRSNLPATASSQFNTKINQSQKSAHSSPWQNPPMIFSNNSMQPLQFNAPSITQAGSAPKPADVRPHFSNSVNNPQADLVRTIPIDGVAKEIRIYDDVAIVFMDWDEPREIGFQDGQRRVCIDNEEPIGLNFNDDFKTIQIQGNPHKIKYGFPSRELYIDKNWYECYFGGPSLSIPLDGKIHIVKIEGPPPQVNIGPLRPDLVVGRINFIVDAHVIIPVFLDGRLQTFELQNIKHTIQFADALSLVLFNNEPHTFEYGGLPKPVKLAGKKYFIRFAALPSGVVPGKIDIKDMICTKPKDKFAVEETKIIENAPTKVDSDVKINPVIDNAINKSELIPTGTINPTPQTSILSASTNTASVPSVPLLPNINIDELFQKLLATGILNNKVKETAVVPVEDVAKNPAKEEDLKKEIPVKPIDLSKPETIKTRQVGMVNKLFCGMQCSSCGLRFPPEQTMKYSQHLDWHFRQNRRERDSTRKAHNRKWYYDLADWIQYEEIEDIEDREKNWFESQQQLDIDMDENSNHRSNSPIPSCPAGPEDVDRACDVCNEKFEHFYNEELEEWHLKSAVRYDDHIYHPICYQDLKILTEKEKIKEKEEEEKAEAAGEPDEEDKTEVIDDDSVIIVKQEKSEDGNPNDENKVDDEDDDDVIVLPNEEPSVTEILDDDDPMTDQPNLDEKPVEDCASAEQDTITKSKDKESQDMSVEDDIVIQEPNIPFTDLDNYIEKDLSELNNDDSSQSSFHNIKIKEEPKDEEENENADYEDAFEDVGTISAPIDLLQDSSDQIIETTSIDDENSVLEIQQGTNINSSANISMDGNVKLIDAPITTIGVNKIKINIAKNISNNNSNNKIVNESNNKNLSSNNTGNSISTIPVITTSTSSFSSNSTNLNMNSNLISLTNSHNENSNNDIIGSSSSASLANDNSNNTNDGFFNTTKNKKPEVPKIEYTLKPELKDVSFKTVPPIESGYDTSGLCSIM